MSEQQQVIEAFRALLGAVKEEVQSEFHYHKCGNCGEIWGHRASDFHSQHEHTEGHTCQVCRTQSYWKCTVDGRPL